MKQRKKERNNENERARERSNFKKGNFIPCTVGTSEQSKKEQKKGRKE